MEQTESDPQIVLDYYDRSLIGIFFLIIGIVLLLLGINSASNLVLYIGLPLLVYILLDFLFYRKYLYHRLIQLQGPYNIKFLMNLIGAINIYAWLKVISQGTFGADFLYVVNFGALTLIDIGIQSHLTHLTTTIDKSTIFSDHNIKLDAYLPFFGFPFTRKLRLEVHPLENSDLLSLNYAIGKSTSNGGKFSDNSKILLKFLTQSDLEDIVEDGIENLDPKTYYRLYLIQPGYASYYSLKQNSSSHYIVYKSHNPVNIINICSKIQELIDITLVE